MSTMLYGLSARVGPEFTLSPDWSVPVTLFARLPMIASTYSESDQKPIPFEWQQRNDHWSVLGLSVGVTKGF